MAQDCVRVCCHNQHIIQEKGLSTTNHSSQLLITVCLTWNVAKVYEFMSFPQILLIATVGFVKEKCVFLSQTKWPKHILNVLLVDVRKMTSTKHVWNLEDVPKMTLMTPGVPLPSRKSLSVQCGPRPCQ